MLNTLATFIVNAILFAWLGTIALAAVLFVVLCFVDLMQRAFR